MSAPTTTARSMRRHLLLGALGVVLVLAAVAVTLVIGRSGSEADAVATPTTAITSPAPAPATSAPAVTPEATGPTGVVDALPVALTAVGLDDEAAVGNGVTARLTDVSVVQADGQGAGSVSGPALRVTVQLTNGTTSPVELSGVDVTGDTGDAHDPAAPVSDGQTVGLAGTLAAGRSATGTYLFSVPSDATGVTVTVGYQAGQPLLVFTGSV